MGGPGQLAGSCFEPGGHLVADADAVHSPLRCKHGKSQLRSQPEQYIRVGDEARHPRRSPRYDLTRLPRGETREEQPDLCLTSGLLASSIHLYIRGNERSQQPRPHRSPVVSSIAIWRAAGVVSAVLRIAWCETAKSERGQQVFLNFLHHASGAVACQHAVGEECLIFFCFNPEASHSSTTNVPFIPLCPKPQTIEQ
jgi:hypothetical protein